MGSIFGIIFKEGRLVEDSSVEAMRKAIDHNSMDTYTEYKHKNIALGNYQLCVPPQRQNQLSCLSGQICVGDVRIDNRDDLFKVCGLYGQSLSETSDEQLILMAYQKWGKSCVNYLNGEYAFAIWNQKDREFFAATDPVGFRPFFYFDADDTFIFCSEIKGVVAAKKTPNYFEEESLIRYFLYEGNPEKTYNKEIYALCGGNILTFVSGKVKVEKYWELRHDDRYSFLKKDEEWYECGRNLLHKSIENRLNSALSVGVMLSGGLDSSAIAGVLSEILMKKNKTLYAISSVLPSDYQGIEKDERKYIEMMGKHFPNIVQLYVDAFDAGPLSEPECSFDLVENFFSSSFYMEKAILDRARQEKIKNMFGGFGGDYWISWSGRTVVFELIRNGKIQDALNIILSLSKNNGMSFLQTFKSMYLCQTKWYQKIRNINDINWKSFSPLQTDLIHRNAASQEMSFIPNNELIRKMVNTGSMGRILASFHNVNAAYSMDSSLPLLDKRLLEFLCEMPLHLYLKDGRKRSFMRNIMSESIPVEIRNRKDKLPFSPAIVTKIIEENNKIQNMLNSSDFSFVFNKYLNKDFVIKNSDCKFEEKWRKNGLSALRMVQVGIVCESLRYLHNKDYLFGEKIRE